MSERNDNEANDQVDNHDQPQTPDRPEEQPRDDAPAGAWKTRGPRSQGRRRLVYGLNITIAILVALVIAVLLNVIISRGYQRISPDLKHLVRYDLTKTRRYSLSEQSIKVLGELEGEFEMIGLFRGSNVHLRRIPRLMDQYAAYGGSISVNHIRFDTDAQARTNLLKNLRDNFSKQLEPVRSALVTIVGEPGNVGPPGGGDTADVGDADQGESKPLLRQVNQQLGGAVKPLQAVAQNPDLQNQTLKNQARQVALALRRMTQADSDSLNAKRVREALAEPMPQYGELKSQVVTYLEQMNRLASGATQAFEKQIDASGVPGAVQNSLIQANQALNAAQKTADRAINQLQSKSVPSRYTDIRSKIMQGESVVILGPREVKVIPVNELYRRSNPRLRQQRGAAETTFLGEEKITGALLSLSMKRSPMVVFASAGQRPALGRGGQYTQVAERLRNSNFEVRQWNAGGGQRQRMRRGQQNTQPPTPKQGQKAIWIVLPGGQSPRAMMRGQSGGAKQRIADHVQQRLQQGDSAMVMLAANARSRFGQSSPMLAMLQPWGVNAQLDRVVMRMQHRSGGPDQASSQHRVDEWPTALKITDALGGMQGVFVQASPIQLSDKQGVTHQPLVRLKGDRLWAETDMQAVRNPANAEFNKANSADSFLIGVAASKQNGSGRTRLIAVADQAWANDMITTAGQLGRRIMPRMAELTGAAFPANSELFVNSAYWLAGMDELIAASPRTQDVPRVNPEMTTGALYGYRVFLLAGLPVLALVLGMGVWFVRRRG